MKLPHSNRESVWGALASAGGAPGRFISGPGSIVPLCELAGASSLRAEAGDLRGRSVLIATADQLSAALALIELDGVASRLILRPPDLPAEHLPFVIESAGVDAIVTDGAVIGADAPEIKSSVICTPDLAPAACDRAASDQTEWVLLTSGTTGLPKMVVHTLATLAGGIKENGTPDGFVWSTFYDIRRYGGLQIFLRAMLGGGSLVLSSAGESAGEFLNRVAARNVTHISGTPSHWRGALMSPSAFDIAPQYVRLSGEIADQAILDRLRVAYPHAAIMHAFASTEAGLAFEVRDGCAGFPGSLLERQSGAVELKIEDGSLRIRSPRVALRYLGHEGRALADASGFVDTGDMVERRDDRYYFVGRRDGVINIGGQKVHPEEVESIINRHPNVRLSVVRSRKNSLTGSLLVADVALKQSEGLLEPERGELEREILRLCRSALPRYKVPVSISFISELPVASTGKLVRHAG